MSSEFNEAEREQLLRQTFDALTEAIKHTEVNTKEKKGESNE